MYRIYALIDVKDHSVRYVGMSGDEDGLSALFYEYYRGYTIYSNTQGAYRVHGPLGHWCLRLRGKYVSFPDIEQAKHMIKYFRAREIRSWESMDRSLPKGNEHVRILNAVKLSHE